MKNLNFAELNNVSGGEKFLVLTSTISITGLPESCLAKFFNNSTNLTLVGITQGMLSSTLHTNCADYINGTKFMSISYEDEQIAASVIEE